MAGIVATNIRLPEEVLKTLRYRSIEEKKSMNRLILEAIEEYLGTKKISKKFKIDPFDSVIGSANSGIKDGSVKHNEYLYGRKR
jgi:hypothetical protein